MDAPCVCVLRKVYATLIHKKMQGELFLILQRLQRDAPPPVRAKNNHINEPPHDALNETLHSFLEKHPKHHTITSTSPSIHTSPCITVTSVTSVTSASHHSQNNNVTTLSRHHRMKNDVSTGSSPSDITGSDVLRAKMRLTCTSSAEVVLVCGTTGHAFMKHQPCG